MDKFIKVMEKIRDMLERLEIVTHNGEKLIGILNHKHAHSPILLFVHGFAGNKAENGLFEEAEKYFASKDFNTFRYDMAGIGDSTGDYKETTLKRQAQDLELVIDTLRKKYPENNLSIIGFSLGATVSTITNSKDINQYIFWSPALNTAKDMFPRYNTPEILEEISSKGYLDKGNVKVAIPIINDFKEYNPKEFLPKIKKPVLLIHGTSDPRIDYKSTIESKKYFNDAEFVKIDGANHSYKNNPEHRKILFEKTFNWLIKTINK